MEAGLGPTRASPEAEGKVLHHDKGDLVSLGLPASSCPLLCHRLFPLWQLLLSSVATSPRKPCLSVLGESTLAHSRFSVAPGGLQISGLTVLLKPTYNTWGDPPREGATSQGGRVWNLGLPSRRGRMWIQAHPLTKPRYIT